MVLLLLLLLLLSVLLFLFRSIFSLNILTLFCAEGQIRRGSSEIRQKLQLLLLQLHELMSLLLLSSLSKMS